MSTKSASHSEHFKFKHNQPTNAVRVENISTRATINEVVALFKTLIGSVKSFHAHENSSGRYLEISFFDQDVATKALCMSGYSIHGTTLIVNLITLPHSANLRSTKRQADERQNLYVLGLPFSLTKSEFSAIFSRYGTVTHCVILATVDNSSRRRGFVVMSSHEEAKLAMTSLTRTQIKGHCLDVSWAVVQRSQGFLDGGDRAMLLDSRTSLRSSPSAIQPEIHDASSANSSTSSIGPNEKHLASLALSLVPTPTLFVTNLPTFLFSQLQDMHPLFYPFGHIEKLDVVETPSNDTSTSAIVEYGSAEVAQEAKETLDGQYYAGHQVTVRFVRTKSSPLDLASVSDAAYHTTNAFPAFDPFARQSPYLLGPSGSYYDFPHMQRYNNNLQYTSPGLQDAYLRAQHLSLPYNCQRNISRSSSSSSRWSIDSVQNSLFWG